MSGSFSDRIRGTNVNSYRLCYVWLAMPGLLFCLPPVWSQTADESAIEYHHTVSGGPSVGQVIDSDLPSTSAFGFDYLYRFHPKWEVGVQFDFVFEKGYGDFEAYSVVPIVAYSITDRVPVFFGVGVDHAESTDDYEPLVRLGAEYTLYLTKDKRLLLLPGGFVDWIDGEVNASLVLALGYTF